MPVYNRLILREAQDPLTGSFGWLWGRKEQANVFKKLPLIGLHQKQIIPFGRTNRLAQTALTVQGISS
jgi:hypothetical protein